MTNENGAFKCSAISTFEETRERVETMHAALTEYLPHLKKLDQIAASNSEIRDRLISPATSAGRVETKVIMPIIYALCFMLIAIVVWFTGVEPNLPGRGKGHAEQAR